MSRSIITKSDLNPWPLQTDPWTLADKLKISTFILSGARLTQGDLVKEYEERWSSKIRGRAVLCSSGSTANILIAMWWKECLIKSGEWEKRKEVLLPVLTWPTSINQFIMLGFKPVFFDISPHNWCLDHEQVGSYLRDNKNDVAGIFPTSLLGMTPDLKLLEMATHANVKIAFDNCEASFNTIDRRYYNRDEYGIKEVISDVQYISSLCTSSTSTYVGHYTSSIEGGIIHCTSEQEYRFYLLARNHGLVRSLIPYSHNLTTDNGMNSHEDCWEYLYNQDVDPQFDFAVLGNNFRSTDLNAKFGLLDSKRWNKYIDHRNLMGDIWFDYFESTLPGDFRKKGNVPFALPIVTRNKASIEMIREYLKKQNIEYRSLVAGSLQRQTCYKPYINQEQKFPVADSLHDFAMYVGIPNNLTEQKIKTAAKQIKYLMTVGDFCK